MRTVIFLLLLLTAGCGQNSQYNPPVFGCGAGFAAGNSGEYWVVNGQIEQGWCRQPHGS